MKYLLTTFAFLFLFSPAFSFAATYPASCPAEAQGIVEVVGGCSAITESEYGAIYGKCCSVTETPIPPPLGIQIKHERSFTAPFIVVTLVLLVGVGALIAKRFWKK